jgi:hypothetical protein
MDNAKRGALEDALRQLYEAISFPEGGAPDWAGIRRLFVPWARITRITPEGTDALDINGFEAMFNEMIDTGAVLSFFEYEVGRRLDMFGSVAHVLSAYETKSSPAAQAPFGGGLNSIQLVWDDTRWSVVSIVWDEGMPEKTAHRIQSQEVVYDRAS